MGETRAKSSKMAPAVGTPQAGGEAASQSESTSSIDGVPNLAKSLEALKSVCPGGSSHATRHVVAVARATARRKPDPSQFLTAKQLETLNVISAQLGLDEIGAIASIGAASLSGIGALILQAGSRISPMGVIFFMLSFGKSVGKTRFFDFIRCLIAAGHSLNGRFKISTPTDQIRLAQYLHKGPSITPKKLVYRLVHGEQQDDDDSDEEIDTSMLPEEGEPAPNKSEKKNAQKKAKKGKPKTYLPKLESFSTSGFMTHVSKTNLCRSPIVVQDEGRMFWQKTLGTPNPENETNAFVSTVYSTGHFEKTQGIEKYCYDVPY
eukprot:g18495.t1